LIGCLLASVSAAASSGLSWGAPVAIANVSMIHCPAVTQCTGFGDGGEATFNPASPGAAHPVVAFDAPWQAFGGAACPSVTQCTVVELGDDRFVDAGAITFNSQAPGNSVRTMTGDAAVTGLAYPSTTQSVITLADTQTLVGRSLNSATDRRDADWKCHEHSDRPRHRAWPGLRHLAACGRTGAVDFGTPVRPLADQKRKRAYRNVIARN
jgi:hypothetical protein